MSPPLDRVRLLIQQGRFDLARDEAMKALRAEPEDPDAYTLLALSLVGLNLPADAVYAARRAVSLAPDAPFTHYVLARAYTAARQLDKALDALDGSVRLDPDFVESHAWKGVIHLDRSEWVKALQSAERGLELDPEHVICGNVRAHALTMLGRHAEAGIAVDATLANDPEEAWSHANKGWALLHRGRHREAVEAFREALRLDPDEEWARQGIVEALKARHFIYRQVLRYFLWMARLSPGVRVGVLVGLYVAARLLAHVGRVMPQLKPYVWPLVLVYFVFVFLSWTAPSIFNLLLRLHPLGRHALTRNEVRAANAVGVLLLAGVLSVGGGAVFGRVRWMVGGIVLGLMVIPVAGTFDLAVGGPRRASAVYTGCLIGITLAGLALPYPAYTAAFGCAAIGVAVYTWAAMAFAASRARGRRA